MFWSLDQQNWFSCQTKCLSLPATWGVPNIMANLHLQNTFSFIPFQSPISFFHRFLLILVKASIIFHWTELPTRLAFFTKAPAEVAAGRFMAGDSTRQKAPKNATENAKRQRKKVLRILLKLIKHIQISNLLISTLWFWSEIQWNFRVLRWVACFFFL